MNLMILETGIRKAGTTDLYSIMRISEQHATQKGGGKTVEEVIQTMHGGNGAYYVDIKDDNLLGYIELSFTPHKSLVYVKELYADSRKQNEGIEQRLFEYVQREYPDATLVSHYDETQLVM